jgi:hypothetical protein
MSRSTFYNYIKKLYIDKKFQSLIKIHLQFQIVEMSFDTFTR